MLRTSTRLIAISALAISAAASASTISQSFVVEGRNDSGTYSNLAEFDPSWGTLNSVNAYIRATIQDDFQVTYTNMCGGVVYCAYIQPLDSYRANLTVASNDSVALSQNMFAIHPFPGGGGDARLYTSPLPGPFTFHLSGNSFGYSIGMQTPATDLSSFTGTGNVAGLSYSLFATDGLSADADVVRLTTNPAEFTFSLVYDFTAVPEPTTWAMMIGGFGLIGAAARHRRPRGAVA